MYVGKREREKRKYVKGERGKGGGKRRKNEIIYI
jgi:hypothetical protein